MESAEKKLKPNVGIANFYKLRTTGCYYADKTFLIPRLLDTRTEVILFTRPRRFGKTLNMTMLQRFFDCNPVSGQTPAENRRLFEGLSICQDTEAMAEQGKYPVIFMSLKDMEFATWDEFKLQMQDKLKMLSANYMYLLESVKLNSVEKQKFADFTDKNTSFENYRPFLLNMTSLLQKHHGAPAILLIDEYDAPIQGAYAHGYYDEMITFMRSFLGAGLKDNPALKFACLTGVMRIAKESIFSGLNNLTVDTVLSEDFADCFGFTQQEVDAMAKYLGYEDKLPEIKAWYDGYLFGNQEIYNPWSVLNYFKNRGKAQAYWVSTSSNGVVAEVLKTADSDTRDQLLCLLDGNAIETEVETGVSYRELTGETNSIFSFLLMTGYLKPQEELEDGNYLLTIPNSEIRKVYPREILSMLKNELNFSGIKTMFEFMLNGNAAKFQEKLSQYYSACVSFYDTGELFCQGFMLGLLSSIVTNYHIKSNRETGLGRADIMLFPRDNAKDSKGKRYPGIILELKYEHFQKAAEPATLPDDDKDALQDLAQEALAQITAKNYTAELASAGCEQILQYGLAFGHKQTAVAAATTTFPEQ
ncbi:MAG: ATP-binding protein [bacterium]|nr:ATP-binding protein [bacterium]